MLLPGVMAISMVLAGVQAVAMPLITEFQFTREIEDRLLAPIEIGWLAVEKVVAGMIQALSRAWCNSRGVLLMGSGVSRISASRSSSQPCACWWRCFRCRRISAGLQLGQTQIRSMFSLCWRR